MSKSIVVTDAFFAIFFDNTSKKLVTFECLTTAKLYNFFLSGDYTVITIKETHEFTLQPEFNGECIIDSNRDKWVSFFESAK